MLSLTVFLITIIILFCSFFDNQKWLKAKRIHDHFKKNNIRHVEELYKGMTFERYVQYETQEKSDIAKWAYSFDTEEDEQKRELEFKIDYYWNCIVDLQGYQQEIRDLWHELFVVFDEFKSVDQLEIFLGTLGSLTYECGIDFDTRSKLDNKLTDLVYRKLNRTFDKKEFKQALSDVIHWFHYKAKYYYVDLKMGYAKRELGYLEELYNAYERHFELLKSESPRTYLNYADIMWHYYINLPREQDKNYDKFVNYILLSSTSVCRNIGDFDKMSEIIYLYNKGILKKIKGLKKIGYRLLDFSAGFGEKPYRLIYNFVGLQIIFLFVNYPYKASILQFNGMPTTNSFLHDLISTIYFNSTTMLTSAYGDITAKNSITRLVVLFEQTSGFVLSGSFVALFLRKLFRF